MVDKFKLIQRIQFILDECAGKRVLHLGCTNWPYTKEAIDNNMLLHFELAKSARELYGFDFDQAGLDILAAAGGENLYKVNLERLDDLELDETFDVIVAGEVIEHLSNPGLFLQGIQRFMAPSTHLIITTINAYCGMRFAIYALRGNGGINEPVHPDHVAYYSYKTLSHLVGRSNLDVAEWYYYDLGPEHRPHNPWYYNLANDISVLVSRHLSDGVIAVCKLRENELI